MTSRSASPDFIGRDEELDALNSALSASRLVTILGPGGMGKTTLAREFIGRSGCEATFVWLEEATADEQVPALVAEAFGLSSTGDSDLARALRTIQGERVVVIDNAEHVVAAVRDVVAQLLDETEARVIVTSRVTLELPGERQFPLEGLQPEAAAELLGKIAGRRGVEVPSTEAAALVALLDGLPLAIELAASRTTVLSPGQLIARLSSSNEVLGRRATDRHSTLDQAIAWSWELLSDEEREFCEGFALLDRPVLPELVEELWSDYDVLELVRGLQSKSWIKVDSSTGSSRWSMLSSIRRFVTTHTSEERRAEHVARLERWATEHMDKRPGWWADHVHVGLIAANSMEARGDLVCAARLLGRIFFGAYGRPIFGDVARAAVRVAEAMSPEEDPALWADLATRLSKALLRLDVHAIPLEWSERAWAVAPPGACRVNAGAQHAIALVDAGRRNDGGEILDEVLGELDQLPRELGVVAALLDSTIAAHDLGRFELVRKTCDTILEIALAEDSPDAEARAYIHLAYAAYDLGEYERADDILLRLERLVNKRHPHDALHVGGVIRPLVDMQLGRREEAAAGLEQRERRAVETGDMSLEFFVCLGWAQWWARQDPKRSREWLERAMGAAGVRSSVKSRLHTQFLLALNCIDVEDYDQCRRRLEIVRGASAQPPAAADRWFAALEAVEWFCDARQGKVLKPLDSPFGHLVHATATSVGSVSPGALQAAIAAHPPADFAIPGLYFFRFDEVAQRWFEVLTGSADAPRLRVAEDGRTFRFEGQPCQDLSRRTSMRGILLELVRLRLESPGKGLGIDDVIAAGWPGEKIRRDAALTRAYTTMKRLRSLGLEAWILTNDDGYLLDPELDVAYDD